jgi:hypothetical protein
MNFKGELVGSVEGEADAAAGRAVRVYPAPGYLGVENGRGIGWRESGEVF